MNTTCLLEVFGCGLHLLHQTDACFSRDRFKGQNCLCGLYITLEIELSAFSTTRPNKTLGMVLFHYLNRFIYFHVSKPFLFINCQTFNLFKETDNPFRSEKAD